MSSKSAALGVALLVVASLLAFLFLPVKTAEFTEYEDARANGPWGKVKAMLFSREVRGGNQTELLVWVEAPQECRFKGMEAAFKAAGVSPQSIALLPVESEHYFFHSPRIERPYAEHVVTLTPVLEPGCSGTGSVDLYFSRNHWTERWSVYEYLVNQ